MAEVLPLKNLNDLLFWSVPLELEPALNKLESLHPKSTCIQLPEETIPEYLVKTLICHDDGGYQDDRFCNGTTNDEAYRFYNWSCIDVFVYFSHNFITIPPVVWTQTAHIQGVKVLGTMTTEWDEGAVIWDKILSDEEIMEVVINNLVDIAKTFKFEGWLLNFENKISPAKVDVLIKFSRKLTQRMHTINSNAEVIWYDSVTCKGDLNWQNELNSLNQLLKMKRGSTYSINRFSRSGMKLMICEIKFAAPLEFSFAYEVSVNITMIWFTISIQLNHDSDPSTWNNFSFVCEWPEDKELRSNSSIICVEKKKNNWKVKKFLFPSDLYEGGRIRNIKLCGAGPGLIKLGNLSIKEAE